MIGHPGHLAAAVQNSVDDSVISRLAIAPDEHGMGKTMARAAAVQPPDHWHVVTIKPGGLERALRMFALPPVRPSFSPRRVVRAPPTHRVTEALFPGYVFVQVMLDGSANLAIVKTPGALSLLHNSEGPLSIPSYQIDNLKTLILSTQPLQVHCYLKEGDLVRVMRGPLAGCVGILKRTDPKRGRLVVSVDIIKQSVSVELDLEDVEAVK